MAFTSSAASKPVFKVVKQIVMTQKRGYLSTCQLIQKTERNCLPYQTTPSSLQGFLNSNSSTTVSFRSVASATSTGTKPAPTVYSSTRPPPVGSNDDSSTVADLNVTFDEFKLPIQEVNGNIPSASASAAQNSDLGTSHSHSYFDQMDPTMMQQIYYFDTLALTKKLEARGFTREQAEGCAQCMLEVVNSTIDHQAKHMITKTQQQIVVQQLHSEITSVKKDMVLLQKSEFSSLRSETEKIVGDMSRIQGHFQDEVVKLKGQFSLDINLERGRSVEAHAENEKRLQILHNKIDTEIANLKTTFEIYRNDVFKFAGGTVLTCATLLLGFFRLWN